jgi:hypothetical protein
VPNEIKYAQQTKHVLKKILYWKPNRNNKLSQKENDGLITLCSWKKFYKGSSLSVPYSLGRTIRGVSYQHALEDDTFGKMCIELAKNKTDQTLVNILLLQYKREQACSAADIVGLSSNCALRSIPAWALVLPWECCTIEDKLNKYPTLFAANRSLYGINSRSIEISKLTKLMYSVESACSQVRQTRDLYENIKLNGFLSSNSPPLINVMIHNNKWRWIMGDEGNHRAYLCHVLGIKSLSCNVYKVVNRSKSKNWFNVQNKTYDVAEAEMIFDRLFEGSRVIRGMV